MKKSSCSKNVKFELDLVANGLNLNLIRLHKQSYGSICTADRLARFGGELCKNKEDQKLAFDLAQKVIFPVLNKFIKKLNQEMDSK